MFLFTIQAIEVLGQNPENITLGFVTFFGQSWWSFFLRKKKGRQLIQRFWPQVQSYVVPCYVTNLQHMALITMKIDLIVKKEQWEAKKKWRFFVIFPIFGKTFFSPTFLLASQNPIVVSALTKQISLDQSKTAGKSALHLLFLLSEHYNMIKLDEVGPLIWTTKLTFWNKFGWKTFLSPLS